MLAYPVRRVRGAGIVNYRNRGLVNVIDVGSAGLLPEPWLTHAPRIANLLKFEPRDTATTTRRVRTVSSALWSRDEVRDFYIYRGLRGSGSSMFRQNVEYVMENFDELRQHGSPELAETWLDRSQVERVEPIRCTTLDRVLEEIVDVNYHFLKIDAQGAEQEILLGAEGFLAEDCLGLHLELFTLPLYKGTALQDDVISYLAGRGFRLVKRFPPHGSFDSQNDCLFLREGVETREVEGIRLVYGLT